MSEYADGAVTTTVISSKRSFLDAVFSLSGVFVEIRNLSTTLGDNILLVIKFFYVAKYATLFTFKIILFSFKYSYLILGLKVLSLLAFELKT